MEPVTQAPEYDIVATGVSKEFDGAKVISDVDLSVERGQIFGFIGPSGSGKTTTVRLLTGVYTPTEGSIHVLGKDPSRFSRRDRERIGYLPQHFVLYANLSVMENMRFVCSLYGINPFRRGARIKRALEFVRIWDDRGKLASEISGGMRRRLGLAAALVHRPSLIFADEPTAGIDPILREHFWNEFKQLKGQGRTLFVTTQYVTEAEYCDRVALMDAGKIIALDTPDGLRRKALGGEAIDIQAQGIPGETLQRLARLPGVVRVQPRSYEDTRVYVEDAGKILPALLGELQKMGVTVDHAEEYRPNFDEVFVLLLENERRGPAGPAPAEPVATELAREQRAEVAER
jgi:ABC-2 type transport system ATP-binding protein